jgi:hypothetical protein
MLSLPWFVAAPCRELGGVCTKRPDSPLIPSVSIPSASRGYTTLPPAGAAGIEPGVPSLPTGRDLVQGSTMRLLLAAAAILVGTAALADRDDHERARAALAREEILPLAEIMPAIEARFYGRAIEVEFERDDGRWVYEFELITPAGRIVEVEVDAASGRVIEAEHEDHERDEDE